VSISAEFRAFLEDQMAEFGKVSIKKMFGGAGVYRDGLMFALVADDVLYLKADGESRGDFDAAGLPPFTYEAGDGKRTIMSYFRAPEACLDDPGEMAEWCRKGFAAALRANKKKR
jgi:DNA transformation protein